MRRHLVIPSSGNCKPNHDQRNNQSKTVRYRIIPVRASDLDWLRTDNSGGTCTKQQRLATTGFQCKMSSYFSHMLLIPPGLHMFCLPSNLYDARTGRINRPSQEITPLPGIYFFDGSFRLRETYLPPAKNQAEDGPSNS